MSVSTEIYKYTCRDSTIYSCTKFERDVLNIAENSIDFLDIDPFGQPYKAIDLTLKLLTEKAVICITNGEIMQVQRGLKNTFFKTNNIKNKCIVWFEKEYIPYLEEIYNKKAIFFYIFPTSSRVILVSRTTDYDLNLFSDASKYISFIKNYSMEKENEKQLF